MDMIAGLDARIFLGPARLSEVCQHDCRGAGDREADYPKGDMAYWKSAMTADHDAMHAMGDLKGADDMGGMSHGDKGVMSHGDMGSMSDGNMGGYERRWNDAWCNAAANKA